MSDSKILFERHTDRFWRSFSVSYEPSAVSSTVGISDRFNIEIKDAYDGNQDWWLTIEEAKLLVEAIQRKLEALELEKLPPLGVDRGKPRAPTEQIAHQSTASDMQEALLRIQMRQDTLISLLFEERAGLVDNLTAFRRLEALLRPGARVHYPEHLRAKE